MATRRPSWRRLAATSAPIQPPAAAPGCYAAAAQAFTLPGWPTSQLVAASIAQLRLLGIGADRHQAVLLDSPVPPRRGAEATCANRKRRRTPLREPRRHASVATTPRVNSDPLPPPQPRLSSAGSEPPDCAHSGPAGRSLSTSSDFKVAVAVDYRARPVDESAAPVEANATRTQPRPQGQWTFALEHAFE
jgi:hypothetical protein